MINIRTNAHLIRRARGEIYEVFSRKKTPNMIKDPCVFQIRTHRHTVHLDMSTKDTVTPSQAIINPPRPVGEHSGCLGRIPVSRVTVREVLSELDQTKTTQILVFMEGKMCPKRYMTSKHLAPLPFNQQTTVAIYRSLLCDNVQMCHVNEVKQTHRCLMRGMVIKL